MNSFSRTAAAFALLILVTPGYSGEAKPYEAIDRHALKAPPEVEASLPALAKYLAEPCKTDREKARAVYRWITDRIAYDAQAFLTGKLGDTTPEAVLKSRKTICDGFANLFVDLCERMDVKAVKVNGYAKIVGYKHGDKFAQTNHAWNAVQLDGKWQLVDCTWGAGGLKGREFEKNFSDFLFLVPPEALLFSHLPTEEKWQLVKRPLTMEQFVERNEVDRQLFGMGVSPESVLAAMKEKGFREIVKPYPTPGFTIAILKAPLSKHLQAGSEYRFEIKSKECTEMLVANEGKNTPLEKDGDVFRGTVTAQKGQLLLAGTTGAGEENKGKRFWFALHYVVE